MCVSTGRACDGTGFVLLFVFVSGVSVCGCVSLSLSLSISLSLSLSLSVCVCLCVCLRTYTVKKSKGLYKGKQGLKEDPGIYMYHFFFCILGQTDGIDRRSARFHLEFMHSAGKHL